MIIAAIALLATATGAYLLYVELWRHWHLTHIEVQVARSEAQLVRPDVRGLLPIVRDSIVDTEQAAIVLASRYLEAQQPVANVPHSISYAPHMHYSTRGEPGALTEIGEGAKEAVLSALDFKQLFDAGQLPTKGFLLGFNTEDNEPVTVNWSNLYSSLIGGKPGSGKSTLIRSLLAQAAMQNSRFVVLDPHYKAGEESLGASLAPLRALMLCDIASTPEQMTQALRYVEGIGMKRLQGDADRTPVVLITDETTGLMQRGEIASDLIRALGLISQETRKVCVFALCIGQNFKNDVIPTTVRDSFASFISCRARSNVARVQSGSLEFGKIANDLHRGQAVWMTPGGETYKLAVPNCTMEHLEAVAERIIGKNGKSQNLTVIQDSKPIPNRFQTDSKPAQIGTENALVVADSESQRNHNGITANAKAQRALDMFVTNTPKREIIRDVWGIEGLGRQYQVASNEFEQILREHLLELRGVNGEG